ncbi:MAG: carbamoyltransferase [Alphaproteobacteria bacterium]|nr:carbamoyltransferase [Alphaproteobacteria bacterium]
MIVLGVKYWQHDTGASIVYERNGSLVMHAITEARLNRFKSSHRFPWLSIDYCLRAAGLDSLAQVDVLALEAFTHQWPTKVSSQVALNKTDNRVFDEDENRFYDGHYVTSFLCEQSSLLRHKNWMPIDHVMAHAASAYFVSPFDKAAILCFDASTNLFATEGLGIRLIDGYGYDGPLVHNGEVVNPSFNEHQFYNGAWPFNFTTRTMGFSKFGAGKTMALAAYRDRFPKRDILNIPKERYFDFLISHQRAMVNLTQVPRFDAKATPGGTAALVSEFWVNLAREVQDALEEDMLHLAQIAKRKAGSNNLCLAGGVALSCVGNRRILDENPGIGMFVQPAASDEGIAFGCALAGYHAKGGVKRKVMDTAYLGVANDVSRLPSLLERHGLRHRRAGVEEVARLIADGSIIGRCFGASEYGPRALGNRSILADPRRADYVRKLNAEIKHRESFRPFAPSVLWEKTHLYFDMPVEGPFMIVAAPVKPEMRDRLPAITHVDGSSRPQTVRREQNPDYYDLIKAFGDLTGLYVLVNTSFNNDGEPIVETYEDAVISLCVTGLDYLHVDGFLVEPPADRVGLARKLSGSRSEAIEASYQRLAERHCDRNVWNDFEKRLRAEGFAMP